MNLGRTASDTLYLLAESPLSLNDADKATLEKEQQVSQGKYEVGRTERLASYIRGVTEGIQRFQEQQPLIDQEIRIREDTRKSELVPSESVPQNLLAPQTLQERGEYSLEQREADLRLIQASNIIVMFCGLSGSGKTFYRDMLGRLNVADKPLGHIVTSCFTRDVRDDERATINGISMAQQVTQEEIASLRGKPGVLTIGAKTGGYMYDLREQIGHGTLFLDADKALFDIPANNILCDCLVVPIFFQASWETLIERASKIDGNTGKSIKDMEKIAARAEGKYLDHHRKLLERVGHGNIVSTEYISPEEVLDDILRLIASRIREYQKD